MSHSCYVCSPCVEGGSHLTVSSDSLPGVGAVPLQLDLLEVVLLLLDIGLLPLLDLLLPLRLQFIQLLPGRYLLLPLQLLLLLRKLKISALLLLPLCLCLLYSFPLLIIQVIVLVLNSSIILEAPCSSSRLKAPSILNRWVTHIIELNALTSVGKDVLCLSIVGTLVSLKSASIKKLLLMVEMLLLCLVLSRILEFKVIHCFL